MSTSHTLPSIPITVSQWSKRPLRRAITSPWLHGMTIICVLAVVYIPPCVTATPRDSVRTIIDRDTQPSVFCIRWDSFWHTRLALWIESSRMRFEILHRAQLIIPSRPEYTPLPYWTYPSRKWMADNKPDHSQTYTEAYGWPLRAAVGSVTYVCEHEPDNKKIEVRNWGIPFVREKDPQRTSPGIIPLRPIWCGLLTDYLCYYLILSLPFFAFGVVRTVLRARRSRCINCGYLLTGNESGICPECGWERAAIK